LLVLLTAVAVGAVVVTIALTDDTVPGTPTDSVAAAPTSRSSSTPKPEDRDPAAVTAALRRLDPCLLLDLTVAKQRQVPNAVTVPTGPHTCVLAANKDSISVQYGMHLGVGLFSDQLTRYSTTPIVLAGAKAYELARDGSCHVIIPVSFVRAIVLYYMQNTPDLCSVVRQYAEATVTKLRDPDTAAYRDTTHPFAAWDACSLLRTVTGENSAEYQPFDEPDMSDPLVSTGDLLSGCRTAGGGSRLQIVYGNQRHLEGDKSRRINGKTVLVSGSGPCTATWDHGPSGSPVPEYATASVIVTGKDCVALAERVMPLADRQPDDVAPFHPLLYGPDDDDTGSLGACADLGVTGVRQYCEPYHEVSVPEDPDDILAAAKKDTNVQCAVFLDAMKETFGEQFAPVTWGEHCFFVNNEHMLQIKVNVDPENPPSDYGADPGLWMDREETEIAGRPAVRFWDTSRNTFDIYLSPYDDLDRPGNLHIRVEMIGGRGREPGTAPPLPQDTADLATTAMTRAVETYFH
jgi:hypothetical protein